MPCSARAAVSAPCRCTASSTSTRAVPPAGPAAGDGGRRSCTPSRSSCSAGPPGRDEGGHPEVPSFEGLWLRRLRAGGADRVADALKLRRCAAAQELQGDDADDGDQGDEEHVLHQGGALLVTVETALQVGPDAEEVHFF